MYEIILLLILLVCILILIKQPIIIKQPLITKCNISEEKQLPWCKKWNNNRGQFKCYINKHLQRKCLWSCDR